MDRINEAFQEILSSRGFPMKTEAKERHYEYKSRFELEETHYISIHVMLTKGEESSVGQIVFEDIAYCRNNAERAAWLEVINELNNSDGVYYYFCLSEDNRVFMRYVTEVTQNIESYFNILLQGPYLIQRIMPKLEEKFGPFVVR
ncbi:MAG: hypothetical protein Q4B80_02960 [Aerococcaceae bacterium]|nr:hypothetical protein [Aerococcaceae bacterium]